MRLLAEFALFLVAAFAAALFVPRLLRSSRVTMRAGAAAGSPQHEDAPAGEPAEPAEALTGPFAYDSGVTIGTRP